MRKIPLLAASAAVVLIITLGEVPWNTMLASALQNTAHVPASAVLFLLLRALLGSFEVIRRRPAWWADAGAFLVCVALGIAIEVVQGFIGRDAAVSDVARDAAGGMIAWSAVVAFSSRSSASTRALAAVIALAAASWTLAPLTQSLLAYRYRQAQFPVLAQFQNPRSEYFVESSDPAMARRVIPSNWSKSPRETGLYVPLNTDPWPGVQLVEPYPDWRGYRQLSLELLNPSSRELQLNLRVDDATHALTWNYYDRFNTRLRLPAGQRIVIDIPTISIENAPRGRRMDMSRISNLQLFADRSIASEGFYICHVRLQ